MKTRDFLRALDQPRVVQAIVDAEKRTSGEIRIFVSHRNVNDPLVAARDRFQKLGMEKTAERNGILIFFAPEAQKYAVVGDKGIHECCGGDDYWQHLVDKILRPSLKGGNFTDGIVQAITEIGSQLATHFPPRKDGTAGDELPNEIATDEPV